VLSDVWYNSVRIGASWSAAALKIKDGIESGPVASYFIPIIITLSSCIYLLQTYKIALIFSYK
jgi:hypothetical protein